MRFTTRLALNEYLHVVLHDIRHIDAVISLADLMVQRLYDLVGGRLWMATHMRRGDCKTPSSFVAYYMLKFRS